MMGHITGRKALHGRHRMKKILLIICIILTIFQILVLATAIDIGSAAIDRGSAYGADTLVNKINPSDGSGKITSVEIWANEEMADCEVATFFVVSGSNLSTRDYETVDNGNGAGVVLAGSKQTFVVDLDVEVGDYIGIYYSSGSIDYQYPTGDAGWWYGYSGDRIPCTNYYFGSQSSATLSLYGTGATEEEEEEGDAIFFGTNF